MKRVSILLLISLFLNFNICFALATQSSLPDMVDVYAGTEMDGDNLVLEEESLNLTNLYVAQDYSEASKSIIFVTSENGTYKNITFEDNFYQNETWPEAIKNEAFKIAYNGEFSDEEYMMAYNDNSIYSSYDKGNSWTLLLENDETLKKVDFGPDYTTSRYIYFITDSGLYRYAISVGTKELVLESDTEGSVTDFNFLRRTTNSSRYFVAKGDKLLKTNDFGNTWIETVFDNDIKFFALIPDGTSSGKVALVTEGNKLFYESAVLEFFEIPLPSDEIYAMRYAPESNVNIFAIYTDTGLYISYDRGDNWSNLIYSNDFSITPVKDFYVTRRGADEILFAILGNKLYRDLSITGEFEEYMNGIGTQAYVSEGYAESSNILELESVDVPSGQAVGSATLNVTEELNNQTINYYLTADGVNWEQAVPGELHTFENPGTVLKWKAELLTNDTSVTPVLNDVSLEYDFVEVTECAGFTDIPVDDSRCDIITYVKSEGIFTGYPDGSFKPDQAINRAEVVKVITEGFDYSILAPDGTDLGFSDVIIGEWYMGYLRTAKEELIIEGYPDGTYKPEQTVNYVEMLKIFLETADITLEEPTGEVEWYQKYVDYADSQGLIMYENIAEGMKRIDVAQLFYEWHQLGNI